MPKISGLMNDREVAICSRIWKFREMGRWSQSEFAERLGISKAKLASIEYGIVPLRFGVAWSLITVFHVNPQWIYEGEGSLNALISFRGSEESLNSLKKRLFSDAYETDFTYFRLDFPPESGTYDVPADAFGRVAAWHWVIKCTEGYFWMVPDPFLKEYLNKVLHFAEHTFAAYPRDPQDLINKRALKFKESKELCKAEVAGLTVVGNVAANENRKKELLTQESEKRNVHPVITEMPQLLERIRQLTRAKGRKRQLAAFMQVPPSRISEWLSDKYQPNGDATIRLLRWVEKEASPKAPGAK